MPRFLAALGFCCILSLVTSQTQAQVLARASGTIRTSIVTGVAIVHLQDMEFRTHTASISRTTNAVDARFTAVGLGETGFSITLPSSVSLEGTEEVQVTSISWTQRSASTEGDQVISITGALDKTSARGNYHGRLTGILNFE